MSAVKYVRRGAVFADIGTDHAYLPIYLLKEGIIERAVLSDVNRGPLASAEENAREAGVLDRVELVLTDGAAALEGRGITDLAIFGMGGELIADIIERAPFLKNENIRLVLQPMTKQPLLCDYLAERGFGVEGECYTCDAGRFYRTLCVCFGADVPLPEGFSEIGFSATPCEETKAKIGYLRSRLSSLERAVSGKLQSGRDAEDDIRAAELVRAEIKRLNERNPI